MSACPAIRVPVFYALQRAVVQSLSIREHIRMRRDGIQHQMSPNREITVAPDRFEVTADDAILVTELRSALAICLYDAVEEAGALLHLRCIVRSPKPADMTDS